MIDFTNLSVLRQNFANVVYTMKIHEICKEKAAIGKVIYAIVNIILIGLTFVIITFGNIFFNIGVCNIFSSLFSLSALILFICTLVFNPNNKYKQHETTANKLLLIREKYINLMADIVTENISSDLIKQKSDGLVNEVEKIYAEAPYRSRRCYKEAQRRLRGKNVEGEDFTTSDKEIDRFLPSELKYSTLKDNK
ncbi:MAG: hypothetical protein BKP49_02445 [Treponema sp. CETP13]|nr:MAG: hypothetical protein BKP49_02445 [Treponema sp. CETP13]